MTLVTIPPRRLDTTEWFRATVDSTNLANEKQAIFDPSAVGRFLGRTEWVDSYDNAIAEALVIADGFFAQGASTALSVTVEKRLEVTL